MNLIRKKYTHNERDKIRRPAIAYLRQMKNHGQLNKFPFFYWTCPPDMGKQSPQVLFKMKLDGYEKGVYDLCIIAGSLNTLNVWLIEFKYGKNSLTKEQKEIYKSSHNIKNIKVKIIRNIDEFMDFINTNFV